MKYKASGNNRDSVDWLNYKLARNRATAAIRAGKTNFYKQVLEDHSTDVWHKIRTIKGSNNTASSTINKLVLNDVTYTSPSDIANSLNDYFSTIGLKLNQSKAAFDVSPNTVSVDVSNGFYFSEVDSSIVSQTLYSLKGRKTGGVHQVPAFIYKLLEPLILAPLTYIINLSISCNIFPNCWKEALLLPLHKRGDPTQPSNYRPISLLPILGKVFEKILSKQIRGHIQLYDLLNSRQFGFRPSCSTDQLVFQIYSKFKTMLAKPNSRYITISSLDIKKAFDSVNHRLLIHKLHTFFNFQTSASKLLTSYLCNRKQSLKCNTVISKSQSVVTGVPQGSVLGPPFIFDVY